MDFTVAICTWNRVDLLEQTLAQLTRLIVPAGISWELLVVNNNCTDATGEVLAKFSSQLPLRCLFEPKQGLSNARNRAISEAKGELILWTDDDVLVEPNWLVEYSRAARQWPDAAFFGGTVEPWFSVPPPHWLERHLARFENAFAIRRFGPEVRPFRPNESPFGANLAFRMKALQAFAFNPDFGRVGTAMIGGEETDMLNRMRQSGLTGVWVGTARVRHYIPRDRMSARYLWNFYLGCGRTHRRAQPPAVERRLWGAPRWVWRAYLSNWTVSQVLSPFRSRLWLEALIQAAYFRGLIDEDRARGREPEAKAFRPGDAAMKP
jgi:glycosyltransferase involved in cell wall biosynthesis